MGMQVVRSRKKRCDRVKLSCYSGDNPFCSVLNGLKVVEHNKVPSVESVGAQKTIAVIQPTENTVVRCAVMNNLTASSKSTSGDL